MISVTAETDVAGLIETLTSISPGEQLMVVNKNWLEIDGQGWTVHYVNETSSCALGEVEGKYVGSGRTLAAALQHCLDNYLRGWTFKMEHDRMMSEQIEGGDE